MRKFWITNHLRIEIFRNGGRFGVRKMRHETSSYYGVRIYVLWFGKLGIAVTWFPTGAIR